MAGHNTSFTVVREEDEVGHEIVLLHYSIV